MLNILDRVRFCIFDFIRLRSPDLEPAALAYARSFASVYECVVDTLFVCAMRDKDEYGGAHMGDSLRDALGLDDGGGGRGGAAASEDTKHV